MIAYTRVSTKKTKTFNNTVTHRHFVPAISPSHGFLGYPDTSSTQNKLWCTPSRLVTPNTISTTQHYLSPFTIASCLPSSNSGCPILPSLFASAIARVTIGMSSVGELVEAGRSGIFGGEYKYRLSHLTGVCTKTYFARKWLSRIWLCAVGSSGCW